MTSASICLDHIRSHLRRRWTSRLRPLTLAYGLLFPSLVFLIIFTYVPIVEALLQAFRIERFGGKFEGYGAGNFVHLFADWAFRLLPQQRDLWASDRRALNCAGSAAGG